MCQKREGETEKRGISETDELMHHTTSFSVSFIKPLTPPLFSFTHTHRLTGGAAERIFWVVLFQVWSRWGLHAVTLLSWEEGEY